MKFFIVTLLLGNLLAASCTTGTATGNCGSCDTTTTDKCATCGKAGEYLKEDKTCVAACANGEYKHDLTDPKKCTAACATDPLFKDDTSTPKVCVLCDSATCETCAVTGCTACKTGTDAPNYISGLKCVASDKCPDGTYPKAGATGTANTCTACTGTGCSKCSSADACTGCTDSAHFIDGKNCVKDCPEGKVGNTSTKKCEESSYGSFFFSGIAAFIALLILI